MKDNRGPAFPRPYSQHSDDIKMLESFNCQEGMTVRDYFAAQALFFFCQRFNDKEAARQSYMYADAMISESKK